MQLSPESQRGAKAASSAPSRKWNAYDYLRLAGYAYSLAFFLFACALALSLNGIAFSPLHLKVKETLAFLKVTPPTSAPVAKEK